MVINLKNTALTITSNIFNIQENRNIIQSNDNVIMTYRKTSSISRTKSQSLNVSCIILQLSSLNPLKPGVKLRMKM